MDIKIPPLHISEFSSFLTFLCRAWSETPKIGFLESRLWEVEPQYKQSTSQKMQHCRRKSLCSYDVGLDSNKLHSLQYLMTFFFSETAVDSCLPGLYGALQSIKVHLSQSLHGHSSLTKKERPSLFLDYKIAHVCR